MAAERKGLRPGFLYPLKMSFPFQNRGVRDVQQSRRYISHAYQYQRRLLEGGLCNQMTAIANTLTPSTCPTTKDRRTWERGEHSTRNIHACSVTKPCLTLRPHGLQPIKVPCPWNSPDKNTWVCCHFFLQRIFLTQGSNPPLLCLLHLLRWQAVSLSLGHLGSPNAHTVKFKWTVIDQECMLATPKKNS